MVIDNSKLLRLAVCSGCKRNLLFLVINIQTSIFNIQTSILRSHQASQQTNSGRVRAQPGLPVPEARFIWVFWMDGWMDVTPRQNVYACARLSISGLFFSHTFQSDIKVSRALHVCSVWFSCSASCCPCF